MKSLKMVLALWALLGLTSFASAQTVSATPPYKGKNPAHHAVHQKLRQEIRRIQMDEKSGKITAARAQALKAKIKGVNDQQKAFYRQNNGADLTASQTQQLNQSLDGIAASH